jgi:Bacterial conjugation TrbI-like protein
MKESEGKYAVLSGGKTDSEADIWNEEELAKILNFDGVSFNKDLDPGLEYGSSAGSSRESESSSSLEGEAEAQGEAESELFVPLKGVSASEAKPSALRQNSMADMFEDPSTVATKPTLAKNPFAKVSVVGAMLGVAFLVAAVFLSGIMGEKKPDTVKVQASPSVEPKPKAEGGVKQDVGDYKTQAAVGSQQQKLSAIESERNARAPKTSNLAVPKNSQSNSNLKSPSAQKTPAPAAPDPTPVPSATVSDSVRSPAAVPDPLPDRSYLPSPPAIALDVERPAPRIEPQPRVQSIPAVQEQPPKIQSQSPRSVSPVPPPDPRQQWAELAALGSFGQGSKNAALETPTLASAIPPVLNPGTLRNGALQAPTLASASPPVLNPGAARNGALQAPTLASASPPVLNPGAVQEQPVPRDGVTNFRSAVSVAAQASSPDDLGRVAVPPTVDATVAPVDAPGLVVFAGQSLSGTLAVPAVAFSGSSAASSEAVGERFAVSLKMPLMAQDGTVALPQSALIIFQVDRVLTNGYVEAHAVAAVDGLAEYRLPRNAVSVRGRKGEPLMATRRTTGGSDLFRMDMTAFVLGAAQQVGERLNQPTSESSTQSVFGSSSSVTRGSPNIWGAVMQGGATPVLQQVLQRNQQASAEIQSRPPLWYVPAKTEVLIFVNSSFELGR